MATAVSRYSQRLPSDFPVGTGGYQPWQSEMNGGNYGIAGGTAYQSPRQGQPESAAPAAASTGLDTKALGGLDSTLGTLGSEYGANREFQGGLRDILMQQLGTAGQPVSATDPNLSPILQAQRATAQRTAERQRSALAGRASGMGLSNSGAMDTGLLGIEQQRGEAEMQGLSSVMGAEQQQRRQMLMGLLNPALALGDSQATQNISQQLGIMGSQLDQSNTYDDAGYRLAALEALLNQQALGGLGGYL